MQIRSRAPLRIGFAGGGTDLPDYSNEYGGAVFNATIGMYAYCTIVPTDNGKIRFVAYDNDNAAEYDSAPHLDIDGDVLILHKGVYNRIVKEFNGGKAAFLHHVHLQRRAHRQRSGHFLHHGGGDSGSL